MAYVMVPVPEEHVADVMQFILREMAKAAQVFLQAKLQVQTTMKRLVRLITDLQVLVRLSSSF